jgi:hypothetical protein
MLVEGTNQRRTTFGHQDSQIMFDYPSSLFTLPEIFGNAFMQVTLVLGPWPTELPLYIDKVVFLHIHITYRLWRQHQKP